MPTHEGSPARIEGESFIFIIGAPRSGTTWLHRMLEQHPEIASAPRELTLISRYLAPAHLSFQRERAHMDRGDWKQGLPLVLSESEFMDGLKAITTAVYRRVLEGKPGARLILDKHPGYTYHLPLIEQLLPGARYIHLMRDGRDTAISMLRAREKRGFGARTMDEAARDWAESVRLARLHGEEVGARRFLEIRYEDLMQDAQQGLLGILRFCGLPPDEGWCARTAEENSIEHRQVSSGDSALNELRREPGAIWRKRMSLRQRFVFDRVAADWLVATGYASPGWWRSSVLDAAMMSLYPIQLRLRRAWTAAVSTLRTAVFRPVPIKRN